MNFEQIETFLKSPEVIYSAIGITGTLMGYMGSRLFSNSNKTMKLAEMEHERYISGEKTRQLELEVESKREDNQFELSKLVFEQKESEHKRQLELDEINHKKQLEQRACDEQNKSNQRQYKLDISQKLVGLKPILTEYLAMLKVNYDISPEFLQEREKYRHSLFEDHVEEEGIISGDTNMDDLKETIEELVNIKFPLSNSFQVEPTSEIKKLIDIIALD